MGRWLEGSHCLGIGWASGVCAETLSCQRGVGWQAVVLTGAGHLLVGCE